MPIQLNEENGGKILVVHVSGKLASARLNAMDVRFKSRLPWALALSFARATHQALYHRARCNRAARRREYNASMERTSASIPQLTKPAP